MKPERWRMIDKLLQSALERAPEKRAAFLEQECAEDEELRRDVESLLAHEEKAEDYIKTLALDAAAKLIAGGRDERTSVELIGRVLDEKYRIEKKLGEGGMGAVYLASHLGTSRPVAVKVIAPQFMANEEFVERFKREAKAAGLLRHPNVVNVTDFGFAQAGSNKLAYLVMEYLNGSTLADMLKERGSLPVGFVVDIVEQICLAVDEAHRQGIIHRDLKPENIWLEPDQRGGYNVKALDFGLAKIRDAEPIPAGETANMSSANKGSLQEKQIPDAIKTLIYPDAGSSNAAVPAPVEKEKPSEEKLTRLGAVLGTPLYMSPEQCRGEMLDPRSDIYSLGVVTYQMLAGETPFKGDMYSLIAQHVRAEPPPLNKNRRIVSALVEKLVMSALAKNPADRPASAAAFAVALRAASEGVGPMLRQAISLYNGHFTVLVRISLICHIPVIAVNTIQFLNGMQTSIGLMSPLFGEIATYFLRALLIVSGQLTHGMIAGLFVPVAAQLLTAPQRPVEIRSVFRKFNRRLRAFVITSIWFIAAILPLMFSFFIAMTAKFWLAAPQSALFISLMVLLVLVGGKNFIDYSLCPSASILEELQGRAALARSKALTGRVKSMKAAFLLPFLAIFAVSIITVLALLESSVSLSLSIGGSVFESSVRIYDAAATLSIIVLPGILIGPILVIMLALFYLKARQVAGETLKEIVDQFDADADC